MTTTIAAEPAPRKISWPAIIWIGALHLGALLAFLPLFGSQFASYFSWSGVFLCLFLHWLTGGVGICLIYHRLLTHRSFNFRPSWLEYPFTMIGCCASEGGPLGWVADHRRHHAHSDEEPDVHTPHHGFFWAHMGWWMVDEAGSRHNAEYFQRWCPDLYKDPVHRWIEKYFIAFPILMMVGLYLLGQWYGGLGMSWLIWGGFVRTIFVLHTTWLVNSATHVWGYRSHVTRDDSTNLWWVALLTYGEGWHNNHHAYQTSARHGLSWWEIDPTYITVRIMQMMGLVYNVKVAKVRTVPAPTRVEPAPPPKAGFGLAEEGA